MINNSISKAVFKGNDVATQFPFEFRVWKESQVYLEVTDPDQNSSVVTDFSVTLSEIGGVVTYLHNGAPLPTGWSLAILRNMPFTQDVDLINGTRFDPEVIEEALDRATAERQELREAVDRSIKVNASSEFTTDEFVKEIRDNANAAVSSADKAATSETNAKASEENAKASEVSAAASAASAAESAHQAGDAAVARVTVEGDTQVARVTTTGDEQVTAVQNEGTAQVQSVENAGLDILNTASQLAFGAFLPGMVVAFSGSFGGPDNAYPIPKGSIEPDMTWKLHEPSRGKFILGGTGQNQGTEGGEESTKPWTLTTEQMPAHSHTVTVGDQNGFALASSKNNAVNTRKTSTVGGSQPHSHGQNLPPYYTLAYIEKLAVENPSGGHAVFVTHEEFQEGLAGKASKAELDALSTSTDEDLSAFATLLQSLQSAVQSSQQKITSLEAQVSALEQATPSYALKTEIPDITGLATKQELASKADESALGGKQNTLVAGANITIDENNVISSTASGNNGIPEAPVDGKLYGRKNQAWAEVTGAVTPPDVTPTVLTQDGKTFTTSNNETFEVLGE